MPRVFPAFIILCIVVALPSFGWAQGLGSGPPIPFADSGACPFEGCRYARWTVNAAVTVHRSPSSRSPIAFRLMPGDTVTAVTGIVVTIVPGEVRFRDSVTLATSSQPIHISPLDTLFLLSYEGEGSTTAWFKGRLYRGVDGSMTIFNGLCSDSPGRCLGRITVPQRGVWWVKVRDATGRTGWTNEPDHFDGMDALGRH